MNQVGVAHMFFDANSMITSTDIKSSRWSRFSCNSQNQRNPQAADQESRSFRKNDFRILRI